MGGNALKLAKTRRYSAKEYFDILPELLDKAKTLFSNAVPTLAYREKESFGDADILCLVDKEITINIKQWIQQTYNPTEIFVNNSVYSFDYKELQIDLILVSQSNWQSSITYYSWNDLHNLIGKLFHRFGLKWGMDGLKYVYNIDGKRLGKIYLTKSYKEAFKMVDLNVERYERGFNNLEEIFEFVIASKYFNPYIFDLENLNKVNRDRDKKRSTYAKFIEYITKYKEQPKESFHYFYHDKKAYLGVIDMYFPGFLRQYRELEKKEEHKRLVHNKFNGKYLMERFNLEGKQLGKCIQTFNESFKSLEDREDFILSNSLEQLFERFKQLNNL